MIKLIDIDKLEKSLDLVFRNGSPALESFKSVLKKTVSGYCVDGCIISLPEGAVIEENDVSIDWPSISKLEPNEFRQVDKYQVGDNIDKETWLPVFRPVENYFKINEALKPSHNSAMVPCQLWPKPNEHCPVGRESCYKYTACQVAQHQ